MPKTIDETEVKRAPSEWATGDEPMTSRQRWFLKDLCQKAKVEFNDNLSKAEASKMIDELQSTNRTS